MMRIIRIILSLGIVAGVYTETGIFTAILAFLTLAAVEITTEIIAAPEFYYAEDYHQQYLAKNPGGYCGLGGTGISCQV